MTSSQAFCWRELNAIRFFGFISLASARQLDTVEFAANVKASAVPNGHDRLLPIWPAVSLPLSSSRPPPEVMERLGRIGSAMPTSFLANMRSRGRRMATARRFFLDARRTSLIASPSHTGAIAGLRHQLSSVLA
jgi:hypothetical protein